MDNLADKYNRMLYKNLIINYIKDINGNKKIESTPNEELQNIIKDINDDKVHYYFNNELESMTIEELQNIVKNIEYMENLKNKLKQQGVILKYSIDPEYHFRCEIISINYEHINNKHNYIFNFNILPKNIEISQDIFLKSNITFDIEHLDMTELSLKALKDILSYIAVSKIEYTNSTIIKIIDCMNKKFRHVSGDDEEVFVETLFDIVKIKEDHSDNILYSSKALTQELYELMTAEIWYNETYKYSYNGDPFSAFDSYIVKGVVHHLLSDLKSDSLSDTSKIEMINMIKNKNN